MTHPSPRLRAKLCAGTAASLILALPAMAQTSEPSAPVPAVVRLAQNQPPASNAAAPQIAATPNDEVAPGQAMQAIVVMAQRTPAKVARQAQKEAPNLINVQTYQEIRKLPDITTAEAVRRIPGLSLETDEGEGRYVNIRGFDADLNSTTFGGLRLPPTNNASPFGGYRAVTLDSIPIGLVGAITVTKSNTPSMDAEALGGTIEITPKTAPRGNAPFFMQGNIGSGYEPLRNTGIVDTSLTTGGHFGPFSIVLTGTYYEDSRGIDDVEPFYFNDSSHPYRAISDIQQRDYELNRRRHAFGIDLGYQPDDLDNWYIRAFDAGYTERYRRPYLEVIPDGNTTGPVNGVITDTLNSNTGTTPNYSTALTKNLRDENETSIDRVVTAGGRNDLGGNILDYHVGYTIGTFHKPYDFNSTFSYLPGANPNIGITYNNNGAGNTPLYNINQPGYLDPHNYQLTSFSNSKADNYDREASGAVNFEHPVHWTGADSESVKFGVSVRLRHKLTTAQPYSFDSLSGNPSNLLLSDVASSGNETYYGGQYRNGVDISTGFLQSKYGFGQITPTDLNSAQQQFLNVRENVFAEYGQYEGTFGRLHVLAGVRVEETRDKENAFSAGLDANGNFFANPVSFSNHYTNVFPSLQFRYEIQPDFIARAAYSSTIARPGFNQSNAALSVDLGSGTVARGNPSLKPATADGFDLSFEKYLPNAGILSLGFFDKEITNYIVSNQLLNQSLPTLFPGNPNNLTVVSYANAGPSYARGIEFNWDQHFRFLPGFLSGFGTSLNYTFVDSSFEIRPGESSPLPSTSEHTWNAAIFYENNGLTMRMAAYSASADLFAIGGDKTSDTFNATRTFLDFGGSYGVADHWALYFNAKNLLDTPHTFYLGTPNRPIQREFYSQTYQLGLRFDY